MVSYGVIENTGASEAPGAPDIEAAIDENVGDDWMRTELCEDALRLGRVVSALVPEEAEVHGLVALMEIQASRARARVTQTGEPILLLDQGRSRWDQLLVRRGGEQRRGEPRPSIEDRPQDRPPEPRS